MTTPAAMQAPKSSRLPSFWPGYVIGRPRTSSCSFANATIEPANEIEPISAERTSEIEMSRRRCPTAGARVWNSASEISAAAGLERNRSATTKVTIVARYARFVASLPTVVLHGRLALPEHLEHAIGDDEAADDVCRREHDGDEADDERERVLVAEAGDEHRSDNHDPVDRVRAGHQRRVQQRRHLRDHLEAEEDREDQDRQLEDEQRRVAHAATSSRWVTQAPAVISSSQSSSSSPPGARCCSSAV